MALWRIKRPPKDSRNTPSPNFFKYLRQEFALDALAEHAVEPDSPAREVPDPAWAKVDTQLRRAQARLERLQAE